MLSLCVFISKLRYLLSCIPMLHLLPANKKFLLTLLTHFIIFAHSLERPSILHWK